MKTALFFAGLLAALALPAPPVAGAQTFSSGPERVALLELYTSEGCSSCPPAEEWLSGLRKSGDLWKKFAPLAFHVAYWDYLGWKDANAQKSFTDRQRAFAAEWRAGSIYTPCFIKEGAEWQRAGALASDGAKVGDLTLTKTADGRVSVAFQPTEKGDYEAHLATIGGGIETKIRAGENAGRTLRHDFVALSLQAAPLQAGGTYTAAFTLPAAGKNPPPEKGLVAWVTKTGDLRPVQTVGGFLSK